MWWTHNMRIVWVLVLVARCSAESWRWPEPAASVRIDSKVRFVDSDRDEPGVQADEPQEPSSVGRSGRYSHPDKFQGDGTLDSLQYCRCVGEPSCARPQPSERACGAGKYLCCYHGPNRSPAHNSEYFNEIDDEREPFIQGPGLNQGVLVGPGGPTGNIGPANDGGRGVLVGPGGPTGNVGPANEGRGVLVGPGGPTGSIGPDNRDGRGVLVGPGGPTGTIGPDHRDGRVLVGPGGPTGNIGPDRDGRGVLVGPDGPTGFVGPQRHENLRLPQRNPDVLVGPEGPTGVIGPVHGPRDVGQSGSAQRGVLVGPGGPTGIIGPRGFGQRRPVLVGPGGPTGIIGPRMQGLFNDFFGSQRSPGILVGPGGPTGRIGPQNYFY